MTGAAARTPRAPDWDGFHNARDLGGLPTRDGRSTCTGAFYRSATLQLVTPRGWREAWAAGFLTARGTTARASLLATMEGLDVARYLVDAGVSPDDLTELRRRLLGCAPRV